MDPEWQLHSDPRRREMSEFGAEAYGEIKRAFEEAGESPESSVYTCLD